MQAIPAETAAHADSPRRLPGFLAQVLLVLRNSIGNVFKNAASQLNNAPTAPFTP